MELVVAKVKRPAKAFSGRSARGTAKNLDDSRVDRFVWLEIERDFLFLALIG